MIILKATPDFISIDANNIWVTVTITLFILSLINERITNFIKLNLESLIDKFPFLLPLFTIDGVTRINFSVPETDPAKEKLRERGIQNMALVTAFFVAAFMGADLFQLINGRGLLEYYNKLGSLGWGIFCKVFSLSGVSHLIGFVFTGFFISLGSKFWHDMLDIVLFTSNLKRKLADPNTFSVQSVAELDEFIALTPSEIAGFALDQYKGIFQNRKNVTYITQSRKLVGDTVRDCIVIYLSDDDDSNIPAQLAVSLPSGRKITVPTVVIKNTKEIPRVLANSGSIITTPNHNKEGTLCCGITKDGVNYLLTCYHVLSGNMGKMNSTNFIIKGTNQQIDVEVEGERFPVGIWYYGRRDQTLDVALIELDKDFQDLYTPILTNKTPCTINAIENTNSIGRKRVRILGGFSEKAEGFIVGFVRKPIPVKFSDAIYEMTDLIEIANTPNPTNATSITTGGDSGALVIDENEVAVGMIFAGNDKFSYAIPMESILKAIEMELITI